MCNKIILACFCILTITFTYSHAQSVVEGTVLDKTTNEALVGASVIETGSINGTTTDAFGHFKLNTTESAETITISYIGYESRQIRLDKVIHNIKLSSAANSLQELIVSANREEQLRTEVPVAISVVSPKQLEETHAITLDQVLNKVPGVFIADLGNEQHMTSIRQPISTKGLFLYLEDGLPTRPTGVFNHNAMNELNMAAIKNIEIIRGPASSTYGAEAIGGVINVITKGPTAAPKADLGIQVNSNGVKRTDFSASNTIGKLGVFLGGYYTRTREGWTEHSDMDKLAGTLKFTYPLSNKTDINFSATYADLDTDMTGSLDSVAFYGQDYKSQQTFTERTVDALRVQTTISHDWKEGSTSKARLFYRNNAVGQIPSYRIRTDGNTGVTSGTINEQAFQSLGAVLQHSQSFDFLKARWIGGLSIDNSPTSFFEDYILVNRSDEGIYTSFEDLDSALTKNDIGLFNIGLYSTVEFSPIKDLRVSASLRYDQFRYDHTNYLEVGTSSYSGAPNSKDIFDAFTPKIGLTYDFGKHRGVYTNFAQGFVPPQSGELYGGVAVPVLEPSVYNNYEVGGWHSFSLSSKVTGYTDVALYRLNATNQILSVQLDDGTRENRNAGETFSRGFEYMLKLDFNQRLQLRWSGTFARHEFVDYVENGNNFNGNEISQGANVLYNWELTYRPPFLSGFRIGVENQFMGPYWMNNANDKEYEGFRLFNIRAGYDIKSIKVWATVFNVSDKLWSTRANASAFGTTYTPGLPRTFQFGLAYNFVGE